MLSMPAPYAYDLRTRVMDAIVGGMKIAKASRVFQVTRETIYQWKRLRERTGDLQAASHYQKGHSAIIQDDEAFKVFIETHCDKTLADLARLYPVSVSPMTIARKLKQLNYSYKKNVLSPQKK